MPAILPDVSEQEPPKFQVIADGTNTEGCLELPRVGAVSWLSHVGHLRSRNEDRFLAKTLWDGAFLLLLVADGAGGHEAGDAAATASVETFDELLASEGPCPTEGDPRIWLHDTMVEVHLRVVGLATTRIRPPASTLVGVLVELSSLCAWRFHVGDSRLYVRGLEGMVSQWTRDHNITNGLIDRGLSVDQAMRIADGGRLTQVVGGTSEIEPEVHGPLILRPGQTLLLCSDGVYGHNENPEILPASMEPGGRGDERVVGLRDDVLAGDAPDNLTAILWEIAPDLEATRSRETVTNSMPSVSADAIETYLELRNLAELAKTEEAERPTDPRLAPEDALTVGAMDSLVPRKGASNSDEKDEEDEEDTLSTSAREALAAVSAEVSEQRSASLAATAVSAERASQEASEDTRSALFLVFGLMAVLVGAYTMLASDMRDQQVSGGAAPEAEVLPELPNSPEFEAAPELPGSPEVEAAAEPAEEAGLESDPELPDEPESGDEELPGEPAVENNEDLELPDSEPEQPDAGAELPADNSAAPTP